MPVTERAVHSGLSLARPDGMLRVLLLLVILREMGSTSSRGGAPTSMAYEYHCGAAPP